MHEGGTGGTFESFVVGLVGKGKSPERVEALRSFVHSYGNAPERLDQLCVDLHDALAKWRNAQSSFVGLLRFGSSQMVLQALSSGRPDPTQPLRGSNSTDRTWPITEAVRRGDAEIVRALLGTPGVTPHVIDSESSGGCGVGSTRRVTPLGEALLARNAELALEVLEAHPFVSEDVGLELNSTFDGDTSQSCLALAKQWGDPRVLAAVEERLG